MFDFFRGHLAFLFILMHMDFTLDCGVKLRSYSPEDGCQLKMKSNLKDGELAVLTDRFLLMQ